MCYYCRGELPKSPWKVVFKWSKDFCSQGCTWDYKRYRQWYPDDTELRDYVARISMVE